MATCGFFTSMFLPRGFWDIPPWSKRNVLDEKHYLSTIFKALTDRETHIKEDGRNFIFYDDNVALLVQPETPVTELLLCLCSIMMQFA